MFDPDDTWRVMDDSGSYAGPSLDDLEYGTSQLLSEDLSVTGPSDGAHYSSDRVQNPLPDHLPLPAAPVNISPAFWMQSNLPAQPPLAAPPAPPLQETELNAEQASHSWKRDDRGYLCILCPRCGSWVGTGSKTGYTLTTLETHMQGCKCRPSAASDGRVRMEARAAREVHLPPSNSPAFRGFDAGPYAVPTPQEMAVLPPTPFYGPAAHVQSAPRPATVSGFQFTFDEYYAPTSSDELDIDGSGVPSSSSVPYGLNSYSSQPRASHKRKRTSRHHTPSHNAFDASEPQDTSQMSSSTTVPTDFSPTPSCCGIALVWPHADFFETYPFQRHDLSAPGSLGYKLCAVGDDGQSFRIQSYRCTGSLLVAGDEACVECLSLTGTVKHLAEMSGNARPHTNYKYRSHKQLNQVTEFLRGEVSRLRCMTLNLGRRVASVLKKLDDHRRFLMAIANGDPRGIKHLITQGLKDRVSTSELLKRVDESTEGVYHARGYSAFDFDLALLILRLGGRKLLYAMNHCLAIPSIRALRRARRFT
ncbi:uncharacterized protein C8Q71DRAFT_76946 [Rhodofomes roseus]|uniref:Uncharacterized protein n=1 Tax=Rhodofomes roseus TaxID=34475 RepID=A0ABQ8KFA9_9APHY|nr:uncharacterized protein C8Q71DRAFT_76946 [Rhodofomes roseus]KAH9836314.1 hypothetical protein C8Q71DRAFT_76946 [Rhodofomes roseus]